MAFLGFASQALDQSRRDWEQLFGAQHAEAERQKLAEAQFAEQQAQAKITNAQNAARLGAQQAQMTQDKAFKEAELDLRRQELANKMDDSFLSSALEVLKSGNYTAESIQTLRQTAFEQGSRAGALIDLFAYKDFGMDSEYASKVVNAVGDRTAGIVWAVPVVTQAAGKYWDDNQSTLGMSREDFIADRVAAAKATNEFVEQSGAAKLAGQEASNLETEARTRLAGTNADKLVQEMDMNNLTKDLVLRQMNAQADLLEGQATEENIRNGFLPAMLAQGLLETDAKIRNLNSNTEGTDLANNFTIATFDDAVAQMHAKTQISESEARVALATETFKKALAEGEVKTQKAQLDLMEQALTINANADEREQELFRQGRIQMLGDLVSSGNTEMLDAFGETLLTGVLPPDVAKDVLEDIKVRAQSNLSKDEQLFEANLAIQQAKAYVATRTADAEIQKANNEAQVSQFIVDNWQGDHDFDKWVAEENIKIAWSNANAIWARLAQDGARAAAGSAPPSIADLMKDVKSATGFDLETGNQYREKIADLTRVADIIERTNELPGDDGSGTMTAFMTQYNLLGLTPEQAVASLRRQARDTQELLVSGLSAVGTYLMANGVTPTSTLFGVSPDNPDWLEVSGRLMNAGYSSSLAAFLTDDPSAGQVNIVHPALQRELQILGDTLAGGNETTPGALFTSVQSQYDSLVEKYGTELLQSEGIYTPMDLLGKVNNLSNVVTSAMGIFNTANTRYGGGFDVMTTDGRIGLKQRVDEDVRAVNLMQDVISRNAQMGQPMNLKDMSDFMALGIYLQTTWGDGQTDPRWQALTDPNVSDAEKYQLMFTLYGDYVTPVAGEVGKYASAVDYLNLNPESVNSRK